MQGVLHFDLCFWLVASFTVFTRFRSLYFPLKGIKWDVENCCKAVMHTMIIILLSGNFATPMVKL